MDQMFCANQIVIPPTLPSILKKYAKAAIRTQPYDLLVWSAAYFRAMATGNTPPVKIRLEFPLPENRTLTLGYVKLLVYQFGRGGEVARSDLTEKWNDVCLPSDTLKNILRLGNFAHMIEWDKFVAITLGFLEENLKGTMLRICEVFTEEPEGGNAMVPCKFFLKLYRYLGEMDCGVSRAEPVSEEILDEEKKPCLPHGMTQQESDSDRDIDSVIKEIGDVESKLSLETRLEGTGAELDWSAVEPDASESEVRVGSEPSDEGATSKYGLEVMGEDGTYMKETVEDKRKSQAIRVTSDMKDHEDLANKGELQNLLPEKKVPPYGSVKDSELSEEMAVDEEAEKLEDPIGESTSLVDLNPTLDKEQMADIIEEGLQGIEVPVPSEIPVDSDVGSVQEIIPEKTDGSVSSRETQISESIKPLGDVGERKEIDEGDVLGQSMSLTDVRPTMDRETRKKSIESALMDDEERKKEATEAAEWEEERKRIEEESKSKFHMYVAGIGPVLPEDIMSKFEEYMMCCAERQADMVMPRNIRHFLCPPLDLESVDNS